MDGGEPGSWRQDLKDALDTDEGLVVAPVRRMFVAMANRGDGLEKKLDRAIVLLVSATITFGTATASGLFLLIFD